MAADVDRTVPSGHVLVVCTGNVCRSPYIERLLARELADTDIVVSSAGTGALVGAPIDPESVTRLTAAGAHGGGFTARQISREIVAEADLVISATRDHLSSVVPLHPRALRYAFALHDLGDLLAAVSERDVAAAPGANRVAKVAAAAIAKRGVVHPRLADTADVIDPFRRDSSVFDQMTEEIAQSLPTVAAVLRGPAVA
ncbi:low molecular weight phosphatase family protein [Knoellia sp. CPCC 206435]|uniref:arsenate reductase/protein-tyrosine-phosphatase family protein n=1 Tax=Knoellia terrae TaxID=3404797 RepID=UPI003B42E66C